MTALEGHTPRRRPGSTASRVTPRRCAVDGVTVDARAPALIEDAGMLPGEPGALATMIPVGRLGRPEEVADPALAVPRNGYMTDQVVSLGGGMHPR
jgi:NAD(P)-dependent dehydrogenase (short-subunit alcohol dehydrogenase family)